MAWFAVYRISDGRLVSSGGKVADTLKAGLASKEYAERPGPDMVWDEAALDYVQGPAQPEIWTAQEFWRRFTMGDHGRILIGAQTDARTAAFVHRLEMRDSVRSNSATLDAALTYFVGQGYMTAARANAVKGG